jgi:arylsulfatase A-like enzyme
VDRFALDADPRMTGQGFVEDGFDVLPSRADVRARNKAAGFPDRAAYARWLDDGVGAILDKVKTLGIEEDTLIIFIPDHGSFRHGKATLHDFGMRVPMLLQWKGSIEPGSRYSGLLANIDLAPTLLDLCAATPPASYQMDGLSFKSILFGDQKPLRKALFGELGHSRCIKTKDWKYIAVRYPDALQTKIDNGATFRCFKGEPMPLPYLTRNGHLGHWASHFNPHYFEADQLYNLKTDPKENANVFAQHPEVGERLKTALSQALIAFPHRPFRGFTAD